MITKKIKELGFNRINGPYWDKTDKIFLRETGRSFYDLLREEKEKWKKELSLEIEKEIDEFPFLWADWDSEDLQMVNKEDFNKWKQKLTGEGK